MPKFRFTYCQDKGLSKGMWLYSPIDLRKKHYHCNHCQQKHLTKEGLKKPEKDFKNDFNKVKLFEEWGGSARMITSDGRNVNIAEEMNRLNKETDDGMV